MQRIKCHAVLVLAAFWLSPQFAFSQELIAPADSTKDSRTKDMRRCLVSAEGKLGGRGSYSYLGIWDDLKKHVIKERNTGGFVYTTKLSNRSTPVANDDGFPARRESLFESPSQLSDRYVMCLLSSGYQWKDSAKTYFEEVRDLAQAGIAPAQAELGQLYFSFRNADRRLDYNQFASWTRKAAEQGYPIAQFNLSYAYAQGDGVERNDEEALRWMLRSAESGYARAKPMLQRQNQIRSQLRARREDAEDLDRDRKAATDGDAKAQFTLAARYEDGRGVDRDMKQAIEWYRKSAENGDRLAQGYLGVIYERGRGIKQDEAEAARWYRKAAEQGDGQSQFNLAFFYLHGHGVQMNKDEARKWFERARDNGFKAAEHALKEEF